jgi:hypothetical protein
VIPSDDSAHIYAAPEYEVPLVGIEVEAFVRDLSVREGCWTASQ